MITTVLILVIITRRPIQNFIGYFQVLKWFQYVAIIMIALSGTLVMAISEVVLEYIDNKEVGNVLHTATLLLLVTTFVGIVWFISSVYGKEYYLKQNQLKEEIIISQHKYYNSIYENDREMRKFRHDIRSQLGCLQLLLAEGKTDEAIKHLSLVENNFKQIDTHKYHTGNEILDVIINQKCSEAKKRDIDIRVEGRLTASEFIDAYDMCTIFANALNNGMEACDRIQDTGKIILVSILEHGNTILFQFANPATTEMYETVKKGKTIKEDSQNHGFGMENIRMAVEKNGGELQYQYNDGKITLEIFFEV
ncbi:MAG: sensor histidine kinase [Lachnospiraceae bacterium]|nr:sensor histidine kinase [Lachnospiraceae bacterium]